MLKQVEGDAGLPVPKEAGQQETILVRMDGFPKVFKINIFPGEMYLSPKSCSKAKTELIIFLKDSVIYWKLRADATSNGKFSISNMANLFLVDKVIDLL